MEGTNEVPTLPLYNMDQKGLNVPVLANHQMLTYEVRAWVCLKDICGLFSLTPELFMLLTTQWSTPSTWASNISAEIKKKGVGSREVGQGGVDLGAAEEPLKPFQHVA